MSVEHLTREPWGKGLQHERYGELQTYHLAAEWLKDCETVADWGGGGGFFGTLMPPTVRYTVVDGTVQSTEQVLADLVTYRQSSDGILLRHVLEVNARWHEILVNAVSVFRRRMVVITYTQDTHETRVEKIKSGWPIHRFNPDDLRAVMGQFLVRDERVQTTHPERIYYLERHG